MICKLASPEPHLLYLVHAPRRHYSLVCHHLRAATDHPCNSKPAKIIQISQFQTLYPHCLFIPSETTILYGLGTLGPDFAPPENKQCYRYIRLNIGIGIMLYWGHEQVRFTVHLADIWLRFFLVP